jgi:hypothetical protein
MLVQSPLHLEFRVTLPMHTLLFLFAATGFVLVGGGLHAALAAGRRRMGAGAVAR